MRVYVCVRRARTKPDWKYWSGLCFAHIPVWDVTSTRQLRPFRPIISLCSISIRAHQVRDPHVPTHTHKHTNHTHSPSFRNKRRTAHSDKHEEELLRRRRVVSRALTARRPPQLRDVGFSRSRRVHAQYSACSSGRGAATTHTSRDRRHDSRKSVSRIQGIQNNCKA